MAVNQDPKRYNIVVAFIEFSQTLADQFAGLEEEIAQYSQAGTFVDGLFENTQYAPTIGHLNANDIAVYVNSYNALAATSEFQTFMAAVRKNTL